MTCNLRSIRAALSLTQRELAAIFGQTASNVSHYEAGKQEFPPACARALIAEAKKRGVDLTFNDIYGTAIVGAGDTAPETHQEAA